MYVGNDIVAYQHPRCVDKWKNTAFLEKVLQASETTELNLQQHKDAFLWTLWTLKEAAYKLSCFLGNRNKFHAQQFLVSSFSNQDFNPKPTVLFPLQHLNSAAIHNLQTNIAFGQSVFYGYSFIGKACVHSIVTNEPVFNKNICWGIQDHELVNKDDYSAAVRHFAMVQLAQQNVHVYAMEKDKDGIPFVKLAYGQEKYISLSHDQQFVSYAFMR
jgi:phosphopantetheinyl transferase (holo-ACP synthase)